MAHKDYNSELDKLFEEWESASILLDYNGFCRDGLMYKGEIWSSFYDDTDNFERKMGNENELWSKSEKRIVFLLKDTNGNPKQDYRAWLAHQNELEITHKFFKSIALWLFGIINIDQNGNYPKFEDAFNGINLTKTFDKETFAIVNCKKESGKGSIRNSTLYDYVDKFGSYLKKQIEILNPNIIICGGSGVIIKIVKNTIYPELEFEKRNNWIHYNFEKKIILIDSYHPSARISYERSYNGMMEAFKDFILEKV